MGGSAQATTFSAIAAVGSSAILLYLLVRRRRKEAEEQPLATPKAALYVEDQPDVQLRRRSMPSTARELPLAAAGNIYRTDNYVRAHNQTVFYAFVPAGHQLSLIVTDQIGSSLVLYWRAGNAPVPQEGLFDGRSVNGPKLRLTWRAQDTGAPTALHLVLANDTGLVAPYSLQALMSRVDEVPVFPAPLPKVIEERHLLSLRAAGRHVMLLQGIVNELQRMCAETRSLLSITSSSYSSAPAPRPSHRLLEARAHSHGGLGRWNEISDGWQRMSAEAVRCRAQVRLWRDPDFTADERSLSRGAPEPSQPTTRRSSPLRPPRSASPLYPWFGRTIEGSGTESNRGSRSSSPNGAGSSRPPSGGGSRRSTECPVRETPAVSFVGQQPIKWLPLRQIIGGPHVWPDGRRSYLFSYEKNAAEVCYDPAHKSKLISLAHPSPFTIATQVPGATVPTESVQGSLGNCYFLSAVAAAMGDVSVRQDLIDESLEEAGIYGVSFFVRGRWRMVWVDSYFPCIGTLRADREGPWARFNPVSASPCPSPTPLSPLFARPTSGALGSSSGLAAHALSCGRSASSYQSAVTAELNAEDIAYNDEDYVWQPLYARSVGESREGWLMIVEKAFAKLQGSYEALDGGSTACALAMLSGGVADTIALAGSHLQPSINLQNQKLLETLQERLRTGFVGAGTAPDSMPVGCLTPGHAYAVLRVERIGAQAYVLLRDPWGCPPQRVLADGSGIWRPAPNAIIVAAETGRCDVPAALSGSLRHGEFWLTLDQFRTHCALLFHSRVLRTTLQGGKWHFAILRNEWASETAGGCANYVDTWHSNPQFRIRILRPKTQVVLVLSQFDSHGRLRAQSSGIVERVPGMSSAPRFRGGNSTETNLDFAHPTPRSTSRHHPIGIVVLKGPEDGQTETMRAPLKQVALAGASRFVRASHVSLECECEQRVYTVVPSTFSPGQTSSFMVYVYSSQPIEITPRAGDFWELDTPKRNPNARTSHLIVSRGHREPSELAHVVPPPPPLLRSQHCEGPYMEFRNSFSQSSSPIVPAALPRGPDGGGPSPASECAPERLAALRAASTAAETSICTATSSGVCTLSSPPALAASPDSPGVGVVGAKSRRSSLPISGEGAHRWRLGRPAAVLEDAGHMLADAAQEIVNSSDKVADDTLACSNCGPRARTLAPRPGPTLPSPQPASELRPRIARPSPQQPRLDVGNRGVQQSPARSQGESGHSASCQEASSCPASHPGSGVTTRSNSGHVWASCISGQQTRRQSPALKLVRDYSERMSMGDSSGTSKGAHASVPGDSPLLCYPSPAPPQWTELLSSSFPTNSAASVHPEACTNCGALCGDKEGNHHICRGTTTTAADAAQSLAHQQPHSSAAKGGNLDLGKPLEIENTSVPAVKVAGEQAHKSSRYDRQRSETLDVPPLDNPVLFRARSNSTPNMKLSKSLTEQRGRRNSCIGYASTAERSRWDLQMQLLLPALGSTWKHGK